MGSFNTTCFASQQTIAPDDECLIFPISQQSTYKPVEMILDGKTHHQHGISNSPCHPNSFWNYEGPCIKGTYDDYGSFLLENSPSNTHQITTFFNHLYKKLLKVNQGENSSHDFPIDFQTLYDPKTTYDFEQIQDIWKKIWIVGQESRLFVTDYKGIPCQLHFAVMHKKTAEYLIELTNKQTSWNKQSYEQKEFFSSYLQQQLSQTKPYFEDKTTKELLTSLCFNIGGLSHYNVAGAEGIMIAQHYSENYKYCYDYFNNYAQKNPNPIDTFSQDFIDPLFEKFQDTINHIYIHGGLDKLNIKLSPMVYADQDYHNEIGDDYLKMIRVINQSVKLKIKEKYGEDDDENDEQPIIDMNKQKNKIKK